jgi:hypothetical protein
MTERDESGRFIKGQSGNPKGRLPRTKEEKFYKATVSAVTLKDWREIIKKTVEQAKRGNPSARTWLANYLLGPPQQRLDVTSDGSQIESVSIIEVIKSKGDE